VPPHPSGGSAAAWIICYVGRWGRQTSLRRSCSVTIWRVRPRGSHKRPQITLHPGFNLNKAAERPRIALALGRRAEPARRWADELSRAPFSAITEVPRSGEALSRIGRPSETPLKTCLPCHRPCRPCRRRRRPWGHSPRAAAQPWPPWSSSSSPRWRRPAAPCAPPSPGR
jgi:hypothetical protein